MKYTEECIFRPNQQVSKDNSNQQKAQYFTMIGYQDTVDENNFPVLNQLSNKVFAKCIIDNDIAKYYIKIGTYGKIFNPIGLFSEGKSERFISKIGRNEFEFKQVDKKIFDMYLNFLATKNIAWLNNAERELV